jgi:hypothetical protein
VVDLGAIRPDTVEEFADHAAGAAKWRIQPDMTGTDQNTAMIELPSTS